MTKKHPQNGDYEPKDIDLFDIVKDREIKYPESWSD